MEASTMKFSIVDVFTDRVFGGNPAGVVMIPEGQEYPDDETMRLTAAELRYSETAFVQKKGEGEYKLRYFTPAAEVELCGHATVGSFYVLMKSGQIRPGDKVTAETLAGTIGIKADPDGILMDMATPETFGKIEDRDKLDELYGIMGLKADGQGTVESGSRFGTPEDASLYLVPEMVSTGLTDIMMPVKDEEALDDIAPDFPALTELSRRYEVVGVHAFTINSADGMIHARNFAPLYDIDEEAATGTSNGALTFYLYERGIVKPGVVNTVVQGEKMKRRSLIETELTEEEGGVKVRVGGKASILSEGEIYL